MSKEKIRKVMLNKRKNLLNKEILSKTIVDKIINLDLYQEAHSIAIYYNLNTEVNTMRLIDNALTCKKVLLPKVIRDEIIFIEINKSTKYIKSKMGIMEPVGKIYDGVIDLIIVPGVSFDKSLNRLGYGMGYYDRFLTGKTIFKIGICFDKMLMNKLPIMDRDIPMDMIITDKRIIKKGF